MNTFPDLFISCAQGLEHLLADELASLGYEQARLGFRGVFLPISGVESIYRINYCSRIASRVLLPLVQFKCFDDRSLYRAALKVDWLSYIPRGKTFAIDANVTHRGIKNSLFAAQVVKDAICDQFRERTGARPNVDPHAPDVQLNLFVQDDWGVLSFDTSGVPLHKRGYRQESVEAPLHESLAAAILRVANYQAEDILCDPCCGSGTFLIEAALMATRTPPGYLRHRWGFMFLPQYSQQEWLRVKNEADQQRQPLKPQKIFGTDINKSAVYACKINLRAAGFHQQVDISHIDFRSYVPRIPPNLIIANPPHGKRLLDEDSLVPLYRDLGDFMKEKSVKPARGFIFTSSLALAKELGLAAKKRTILYSGGIESRLLEFDLY